MSLKYYKWSPEQDRFIKKYVNKYDANLIYGLIGMNKSIALMKQWSFK